MTIDKISLITGIPRSTIGYYVKKMRRKYGRPLQAITSEPPVIKRSKEERLVMTKFHAQMETLMLGFFKQGDYRKVVELVEAFFAVNRLRNYFDQQIQGEEKITLKDMLEFFKKASLLNIRW